MTPYSRSTKSSGRLSRSTARMLRASVIKQLRCTQPQPQSQPHNHTQPEHRHNSGQPTLRSLAREKRRAHRVCRLSATSSWSHNTSSSSTWRRRYAVTIRRWRACASACCLSYMMAHSRRLTRVVTHRHTHTQTHTHTHSVGLRPLRPGETPLARHQRKRWHEAPAGTHFAMSRRLAMSSSLRRRRRSFADRCSAWIWRTECATTEANIGATATTGQARDLGHRATGPHRCLHLSRRLPNVPTPFKFVAPRSVKYRSRKIC